MFNQNFWNFKPNNIKNKINIGTIPSVFECAALSLDVYYNANDVNRPLLPPEWVRFIDSDHCKSGYFGAYYIKNIANPTCLAWVHRGTVLSNIPSLIDDLKIILEQVPFQYNSSTAFAVKATNALFEYYDHDYEKLNNITYVTVGHSLGAILADINSMGVGVHSITFENPGSKNIFIKVARDLFAKAGMPPLEIEKNIKILLKEMSGKCSAYQSDVNLINTCNEQIGKTFQIIPKPYNYQVWDRGPYVPISSSYFGNFYYFGYTIDQHKMDKIYNYLKSNIEIKPFIPLIGFNNGYVAYLDEETRSEYWKGYAIIVWNNRPDIQDQYNGNFNLYLLHFKKDLKLTHEAARNNFSYSEKHDTTISMDKYLSLSPDENIIAENGNAAIE